MKVSLCTTCKNRLHHLKETLPYNLENNKEAEFILIDYYSTDGLPEWIKDNFSNEMNSGKLSYYRLVEPIDVFILTHAINIAFKQATGDIVCNVDADNFTGKDFDLYLQSIFIDNRWFAKSDSGNGLTGRRAFWREEFINILGGYDEDMRYGWGFDEIDITRRAIMSGMYCISFDPKREGSYIHHEDDERVKNGLYFKEKMIKSCVWRSNEIHKTISDVKIKHGFYKANLYREWGVAKLTRNF